MPESNQRIGEFILRDRIGLGAFGEVWVATHHAWPSQLAAVKMPIDSDCVQNLRSEGLAIHGLSHPNIVRAINFDPYAEVPYLVTEYVAGSTLRKWIVKGAMTPSDAVAVMRQVLSGLDFAHRAGVIHGDVKPENILVHERASIDGFASDGVVKVTDFGFGNAAKAAAVIGSIQYSQSLDAVDTKKIGGTLDYMSPEQRIGATPEPRTDVYACGAILFELLTGERPVGTEVPSELRPGVPAHLDEAYRRAVARHEKRFASAQEFLAALVGPSPKARSVRIAVGPPTTLSAAHRLPAGEVPQMLASELPPLPDELLNKAGRYVADNSAERARNEESRQVEQEKHRLAEKAPRSEPARRAQQEELNRWTLGEWLWNLAEDLAIDHYAVYGLWYLVLGAATLGGLGLLGQTWTAPLLGLIGGAVVGAALGAVFGAVIETLHDLGYPWDKLDSNMRIGCACVAGLVFGVLGLLAGIGVAIDPVSGWWTPMGFAFCGAVGGLVIGLIRAGILLWREGV